MCAADAGANAATADVASPEASAARALLAGGQLPPAIATAMAAAVATTMAVVAADSAADAAHTAVEAAAALRHTCTDAAVLESPEVRALLALVLPRRAARRYVRRWLRAVMAFDDAGAGEDLNGRGDARARALGRAPGAPSESGSESDALGAERGSSAPGSNGSLGGAACRRGLQIEGVPAHAVEELMRTLMPLLAQAAAATGQQLLVFERERVVHDVRLRVELRPEGERE